MPTEMPPSSTSKEPFLGNAEFIKKQTDSRLLQRRLTAKSLIKDVEALEDEDLAITQDIQMSMNYVSNPDNWKELGAFKATNIY